MANSCERSSVHRCSDHESMRLGQVAILLKVQPGGQMASGRPGLCAVLGFDVFKNEIDRKVLLCFVRALHEMAK